MSAKKKYKQIASYTELVPSSPLSNPIETDKIFFEDKTRLSTSPIDIFILDSSELNKELVGSTKIQWERGMQLLLCYSSAFERYLRLLIRGLINIDAEVESRFHDNNISFISAMSCNKENLPEALLEHNSLMSKKELKKALTNGIVINNFFDSGEPKKLIEEFEKICQLRHCAIHRYGNLSSNVAFKLGIADHVHLIDYRLELDIPTLTTISDLFISLVSMINNAAFQFCLERKDPRTKSSISKQWNWDYTKDKLEFSRYYKLFSSKHNTPPSLPAKEIYLAYKNARGKK